MKINQTDEHYKSLTISQLIYRSDIESWIKIVWLLCTFFLILFPLVELSLRELFPQLPQNIYIYSVVSVISFSLISFGGAWAFLQLGLSGVFSLIISHDLEKDILLNSILFSFLFVFFRYTLSIQFLLKKEKLKSIVFLFFMGSSAALVSTYAALGFQNSMRIFEHFELLNIVAFSFASLIGSLFSTILLSSASSVNENFSCDKEISKNHAVATIFISFLSVLIHSVFFSSHLYPLTVYNAFFEDAIYSKWLDYGFIAILFSSGCYVCYSLFNSFSYQMTKQIDQLIQQSQLKGQFVSYLTHELRTPLNGIIGITRMVLDTLISNSQREHINKIKSSAMLLNSLVNELLDYSKIEAKKLELDHSTFSLDDVLDRVALIISPRCHEKGIIFLVHVSNKIPAFLLGDPLRLEQILLNFLSNAVKYTKKGHIELKIEILESSPANIKIKFLIRDTGSGIPPYQLPHIFEPFYQTEKTSAHILGSSGLGLSIARELIYLMNGQVKVESEMKVGTNFSFDIQLGYKTETFFEEDLNDKSKRWLIISDHKRISSVLNEQLIALGGITSELNNDIEVSNWIDSLNQDITNEIDAIFILSKVGLLDGVSIVRNIRKVKPDIPILFLCSQGEEFKYNYLVEEDNYINILSIPFYGRNLLNAIKKSLGLNTSLSVAFLSAADWKNLMGELNILLIEDNPINMQVALDTLEKIGAKVDTAQDGKQGIHLASNGQYDLVLMDMDLPEIDGIAATYWLRNQGYTTPIISMTASDDHHLKQKCVDAGISDFMLKPFDPNALYSLIYKWTRDSENSNFKADISASASYRGIISHSNVGKDLAVDVILGISRVGNNHQLYQKILKTFCSEYADRGKNLLDAIDRNEWSIVERTVHNLKSVSRYIGADALSQICAELEHLLRQHDIQKSSIIFEARKIATNIHVMLSDVFDVIKYIPSIQLTDESDKLPMLANDFDGINDSKPSVLIVDDEQIHRQILASQLQNDCEIILAENGLHAIEICRSQHIDLVLLDLIMPEMPGEEVIRALKDHPTTKDIDIVIISARNDVEDEEAGFKLGATDYITKPFYPTIVQVRITNILKMIKQRKILDQFAYIDGLTGIPNRRKFEQTIVNEWHKQSNNEAYLSIAIMDVDHFKRFNDTYGHAKGDEVLQTVARVARDVLRRTGDFVARFGGEEFVFIFTGATKTESEALANQIRKEIERLTLSVGKITASIGGVTLVPKEPVSYELVLEEADKLLYQAKENGRNLVCWK